MKEVLIIEGQTLYSLVLQQYGRSDAVFQFLLDNPAFTLDTVFAGGEKVLINTGYVKPDDFTQQPVQVAEVTEYDSVVTQGQNLFDLAIQEYGSAEGIWALLEDNPALTSIDVPIQAGLKVRVKTIKTVKKDVRNYFRRTKARVNTGEPAVPITNGIGFMKVQFTFIVG